MPPQPIEPRVTSLERRLTELERLPARIDDLTSQISQLRTEIRGEFSAVRVEMVGLGSALRIEMAEQGAASAARDEAIGIQMRVLHEDVVSRIGVLQEGMPARPKRSGRRSSHRSSEIRSRQGRIGWGHRQRS
jgi:hypothetical protein